jgi:hypothetical protein
MEMRSGRGGGSCADSPVQLPGANPSALRKILANRAAPLMGLDHDADEHRGVQGINGATGLLGQPDEQVGQGHVSTGRAVPQDKPGPLPWSHDHRGNRTTATGPTPVHPT